MFEKNALKVNEKVCARETGFQKSLNQRDPNLIDRLEKADIQNSTSLFYRNEVVYAYQLRK